MVFTRDSNEVHFCYNVAKNWKANHPCPKTWLEVKFKVDPFLFTLRILQRRKQTNMNVTNITPATFSRAQRASKTERAETDIVQSRVVWVLLLMKRGRVLYNGLKGEMLESISEITYMWSE